MGTDESGLMAISVRVAGGFNNSSVSRFSIPSSFLLGKRDRHEDVVLWGTLPGRAS